MAVILVLRANKKHVQRKIRIFRYVLSLFNIYYLMYILYVPTFGGQLKLFQSCPKAIEDGDTPT